MPNSARIVFLCIRWPAHPFDENEIDTAVALRRASVLEAFARDRVETTGLSMTKASICSIDGPAIPVDSSGSGSRPHQARQNGFANSRWTSACEKPISRSMRSSSSSSRRRSRLRTRQVRTVSSSRRIIVPDRDTSSRTLAASLVVMPDADSGRCRSRTDRLAERNSSAVRP